jgi:hypothetical protein
MNLRRSMLPLLLVAAACASVAGAPGQLITAPSFICFANTDVRASGSDEDTWDTFQLNTSMINERVSRTFPAIETFDSDQAVLRFSHTKTRFDRKTAKQTFGYILFKPGKEPLVLYGLHDPDEVLCTAIGYFAGVVSADCKGK